MIKEINPHSGFINMKSRFGGKTVKGLWYTTENRVYLIDQLYSLLTNIDFVRDTLDVESKPMDLVFHGGSGSLLSEIRESLDYGVVKMNIDTDTQYAFTRPVVEHMFKNYDGVLKIDGEVGNKKAYDPRAWGKAAEAGMAARVVAACEDLRSTGTTING